MILRRTTPRRSRLPAALAALLLAATAVAVAGDETPGASPALEGRIEQALSGLPDGWYAWIDTSKGEIVVMLHPDQAPQSVANFAALADARLEWEDVVTGERKKSYYYDGIIVHLAAAGTRFEAGDPYGTGNGFPLIWVPPEVETPVNFSQGFKMGLTRAPYGRISAAQFFITAAAEPTLTFRHPCIGTVVKGRETAFQITAVKTYNNGKPMQDITIRRLRIAKIGEPEPFAELVTYEPPGATQMQLKRD